MNTLKFGSEIFVRVASRTFHNFKHENLNQLLKDKSFQSAIYFASESLFKELEKFGFDYHSLNEKAKFSVEKYYNRTCFRSTPFALFASVGTAAWKNKPSPVLKALNPEVNILPDFNIVRSLNKAIQHTSRKEIIFTANNTIYQTGSNFRFLNGNRNIDNGQPDFKIYSFKGNLTISKVLQYCSHGRSRTQIIDFCAPIIEDTELFIDELIASNILVSDEEPCAIGDPVFLRDQLFAAVGLPQAGEMDVQLARNIYTTTHRLENLPLDDIINLKWPLGLVPSCGQFYVNSSVAFKGGINTDQQPKLLEGIMALARLIPEMENQALQKFKEQFKQRFDNQEVLLLLALDPDTGIGYSNMEKSVYSNELLEGITFDESKKSNCINWSPLQSLLINKLAGAGPYGKIEITDVDLASFGASDGIIFPPSFSVLFTKAGDQVVLERVGGSSAATLAGRFSLFNDDLLRYNKEIVTHEEKTNDEVLFAEIACPVEPRVANIVTRGNTYRYQIPLLQPSKVNPEHQIAPNDLYISIVNDKIILRSKSRNKVIIPRFSSAYNYTRHDLAIFRFLCDLQFQSIKVDLTLDLATLLPDLSFYPRVTYKNCIIHSAAWALNNSIRTDILNSRYPLKRLKEYFSEVSIPQLFVLISGDNSLLIDQESEQSLSFFLKCIRQSKFKIMLKETFITTNSIVNDSEGNPLANEMIASILNYRPSYAAPDLIPVKKPVKIQRSFLPGDKWLYFKIYCSPYSTDEFIGTGLFKTIARLLKENLINQWFFLRFNDPDHHIRVRIKCGESQTAAALTLMNMLFKSTQKEGLISRVAIDSYNRELERYGYHILKVEEIFQASSSFAVCFFNRVLRGKSGFSVFEVILTSVNAIIDHYDGNLEKKTQFTAQLVSSFSIEFNLDKETEEQLNLKYRQMRKIIEKVLEHRQSKVILSEFKFEAHHLQLLSTTKNFRISSANSRMRLFADVIHMHINRLLSENQRKQEFIFYYFLKKYYNSLSARRLTQLSS